MGAVQSSDTFPYFQCKTTPSTEEIEEEERQEAQEKKEQEEKRQLFLKIQGNFQTAFWITRLWKMQHEPETAHEEPEVFIVDSRFDKNQ